jgi:hypothetical protein
MTRNIRKRRLNKKIKFLMKIKNLTRAAAISYHNQFRPKLYKFQKGTRVEKILKPISEFVKKTKEIIYTLEEQITKKTEKYLLKIQNRLKYA